MKRKGAKKYPSGDASWYRSDSNNQILLKTQRFLGKVGHKENAK